MQEFLFKMIDDGTFCVTQYSGDEAEVVLPDRYCGAAVTAVGDRVFAHHPEIRSVFFPDTVTDIGEFVFDGCAGLSGIRLPEHLVCLWGLTFVRCGIREITLPDSLSALPPMAFKDCKNLRRVVCGKGLREICSWAFSGCDSLEELITEPGVKISPKAFERKDP